MPLGAGFLAGFIIVRIKIEPAWARILGLVGGFLGCFGWGLRGIGANQSQDSRYPSKQPIPPLKRVIKPGTQKAPEAQVAPGEGGDLAAEHVDVEFLEGIEVMLGHVS